MANPTPPSPLVITSTWNEVFKRIDQWDDAEPFVEACSQKLQSVPGFRRLCSPKIGHLVRLESVGVLLVHNIHQEHSDSIVGGDDELRALTGAGSIAATVVLDEEGTYGAHTGMTIGWSTMKGWSSKADMTYEAKDAKRPAVTPKPKTKPKSSKTPSKRAVRTRTARVKTKKGRAYEKAKLKSTGDSVQDTAGESDEEEAEDEEFSGGEVTEVRAAMLSWPNVLPVPGFLFAAMMDAYSSSASTLCLIAVKAIRDRAIEAGQDPDITRLAQVWAYVPAGYGTGPQGRKRPA